MTNADDLEESKIGYEPRLLTFSGELGEASKFPIDKPVTEILTLNNSGNKSRKFIFKVPSDEYRFKCDLHPGSGIIKSVSITIFFILFYLSIYLFYTFDVNRIYLYLKLSYSFCCY